MHGVFVKGVGILSGILLLGGIAFSSEGVLETTNVPGQESVTMENAIAAAQASFPGKVLEAEFEHEDDVPVFEITIAGVDGKTREVEVDSQTGKIVGNEVEEDMENHDGGEKED